MVQNPDGSMQRAAITQSALSKERRELRAAQREADMDNVPRDIGKTWIDPVPGSGGTYILTYMYIVHVYTSGLSIVKCSLCAELIVLFNCTVKDAVAM